MQKAGYPVVLLAPGVISREAGHVDHGKKTDEISLFPLKMPIREPQPSQTQVTTTLKEGRTYGSLRHRSVKIHTLSDLIA